jgi:hypothetical protein
MVKMIVTVVCTLSTNKMVIVTVNVYVARLIFVEHDTQTSNGVG